MTLKLMFEPVRIGRMALKNRIAAPPHAAMLGSLVGTEAEAERYIAYWRSLAAGGTGMLIALNGFIENFLPPGFDPTGVGARRTGVFRDPRFVERMGRLATGAQAHGARVSTQMIMQGGMPHGPSSALSGPVINNVPHALTRREIRRFVAEYRFSAEQSLRAGLDGIELHANHDDLIEWFLSPLTNRRTDDYGGSFEGRMQFLREILEAQREGVGDRLAIGVRLNMVEEEPGGYGFDEGLEIARWLESTGLVDYLHLVTGTGWGYPSYIQTPHFRPAQWAEQAGKFRAALKLPIFYAGRVNHPEVAEAILAAGHADVVAVGRAHLADPEFVAKARSGSLTRLRPCIGTNDCINRGVAEGLPFACTVNPSLAAEDWRGVPGADPARRLLVVGAGPAGLQLALTARERGHEVELWERATAPGGQVLLAAKLPAQAQFLDYVAYQVRRLEELGVVLKLGVEASVDSVLAAGADVVAIATGATARRPVIAGVDVTVPDMWQVLRGEASVGQDVAIVVQEDHVAPLAFADLLGREGRRVTLFIQTNGPAPQLSRYTIGTLLGRLSEAGVRLVLAEAVTAVELPRLHTRHVYSQRPAVHEGFDSVVLACGAEPDCALYEALEERHPEVHVLGDAYAPRRMVFATQQGHALGRLI